MSTIFRQDIEITLDIDSYFDNDILQIGSKKKSRRFIKHYPDLELLKDNNGNRLLKDNTIRLIEWFYNIAEFRRKIVQDKSVLTRDIRIRTSISDIEQIFSSMKKSSIKTALQEAEDTGFIISNTYTTKNDNRKRKEYRCVYNLELLLPHELLPLYTKQIELLKEYINNNDTSNIIKLINNLKLCYTNNKNNWNGYNGYNSLGILIKTLLDEYNLKEYLKDICGDDTIVLEKIKANKKANKRQVSKKQTDDKQEIVNDNINNDITDDIDLPDEW